MGEEQRTSLPRQKPPWLLRRLPTGPAYENLRTLLRASRVHTVCQQARCPNIWECFAQGTATFLILGSHCTRSCRFCAVGRGPTDPPDPEEPARVAEAAATMGLTYVVVTSVTRDDLADGGAAHFARTIREIRRRLPDAMVEVLVPDFCGNPDALLVVLEARPDVLNHNLETVRRLYPLARPQADYGRSLALLGHAKRHSPVRPTKSGLMLGLGETVGEVQGALRDLARVGCTMLTLGQYLQPTPEHLPVGRFLSPEEFTTWHKKALDAGFSQVASGPLVRSSYHARELYQDVELRATSAV
jgi:lipoic acid synthetase